MDDNDLLVHIVSVWPERFWAVRPHYQPASRYNKSNHFIIERGSKEMPSWIPVGHFKEKVYVGHGKSINEIDSTTAIKVATCLVNEWAKNRAADLTGGASMGVWITDLSNPTPERIRQTPEYRQMCMAQDKFCDLHIERARELHRINKYELIGDLHFICAELRNVQGEPWQVRKPSYGGETAKCKWCGVVVLAEIPICHNCKNPVNIDAWKSLMASVGQQVDEIPDPRPRGFGAVTSAAPAPPPPPSAGDAPMPFSFTIDEELQDLAAPRPAQAVAFNVDLAGGPMPISGLEDVSSPVDVAVEETEEDIAARLELERVRAENYALGGRTTRQRR